MIEVLAGALTAFLGWAGGRGGAWWKHSWVRDHGISAVCLFFLYLNGVHSWWLLLVYAMTVGALATYWDWLFGWDNYFWHGIMIGVASLPVAFVTGDFHAILIRSAILGVWMGFWSGIFQNAHIEESGRYFSVGATISFLIP